VGRDNYPDVSAVLWKAAICCLAKPLHVLADAYAD